MITADALPQGDLALLETEVAQELLHTDIPARLAYVAADGTPRVLPINFWWNGTELVMATFTGAAKVPALRAHPAVALTIDTAQDRPHVLLIRGEAGVLDFETRFPGAAPAAVTQRP